MLLLESGDIETCPGPKRSSFIKLFHWNLNGIALHDFVKMPLIAAFIRAHSFNVLCLSETFLDSSIDISDIRKNINGYSLLQVVAWVLFVCFIKTIHQEIGKLTYLIFKNV